MDIHITPHMLLMLGVCAATTFFTLFIGFLLWSDRRKGRYSPFTENFFRLPGHSTRIKHSGIVDELMGCYLVFIFIFGIILWSYLDKGSISFFPLIGTSILVFLLYRTYYLYNKAQQYRLGYEGEEFTGQELNLLMRKGAFVFHDIPYKNGNIDHIVIGMDKVFVIETKARSKPKNRQKDSDSAREAKVFYDGEILKFNSYSDPEPLIQATYAANYVQKSLLKKIGKNFTVIPVVALPGWYVPDQPLSLDKVLVINPYRGMALRKHMGGILDNEVRRQVIRHIAAVSRSYRPGSRLTDSDAAQKFDFWHNPKEAPDLLWDN